MIGAGLLSLAILLVEQTITNGTPLFENVTDPTNGTDGIFGEEMNTAIKLKKGVLDALSLWPNGDDGNPLVPYVFFGDVNKTGVQAGLDHWMEHTCIKFQELEANNTAQPHLLFYVGSGCWSYVGMITYLYGQGVSIGKGCNSFGNIVHEVGHAIGFFEESSRKDRDDHITVLWDNLIPGSEYVYDKFLDNNYGVPYDLTSIMHNNLYWLSKEGNPTIETKDPMNQQVPHLTRTGLTHRDKLTANRMYNCIVNWLADCDIPNDPCLNDGYTGKNCACICPPGTSGEHCEIITGNYYGQQQHPRNERISTEMTIEVVGPLEPGIFAKVITPPEPCHRAVLTFLNSDMKNYCQYQNLVVRTDPEDDYGQIMCASDVYAGVKITSDTEIILTMYNFFNYLSEHLLWKAKVTFERISGCTTTTPAPSCPIDLGPPCPFCDSPPELPRPSRISECEFGGVKNILVLQKGESIIITSPGFPDPYPRTRITCGWKLKAAKRGSLDINCDTFDISARDSVRLYVPPNKNFKDDHAPTSNPKKVIIRFRSWRRNSGPGFRCTVLSE